MSQTSGLSGRLSRQGLNDLLIKLKSERVTGELVINTPDGRAVLWFKTGELYDAQRKPFTGLAALDRALESRDGDYALRDANVSRPRRIHDSLESALAGQAQREAKRAALIRRLLVTNFALTVDKQLLAEVEVDSSEHCQLLTLVDGRRNASEVVEQSRLSPAEALKDLADLYDAGLIKPREDNHDTQPPRTRRRPPVAAEEAPISTRRGLAETAARHTPKAPTDESVASPQVPPHDPPMSGSTTPGFPAWSPSTREARPAPVVPTTRTLSGGAVARTLPEVQSPVATEGFKATLPNGSPATLAGSGTITDRPPDASYSPLSGVAARTLLAFPSPLNRGSATTTPLALDARSARAAASPAPATPRNDVASATPLTASAGKASLESAPLALAQAIPLTTRLTSRTLLGFPSAAALLDTVPESAPVVSAEEHSSVHESRRASEDDDTLSLDDRLATFEKSVCLTRGRDSATFLVVRKGEILLLKAPRSENASQIEQLRREATTLSALSHPNIVPLSAHSRVGNTPYLLMEFVDGVTLADVLAAGVPVPVAVVLEVIRDILAVLDYLHAQQLDEASGRGIIHCHLSPDNLLVGFDGRTRVIDFGQVRANGVSNPESDTRCEARFASPELLAGEAVSPESDIFSVGALLVAIRQRRLAGARGRSGDDGAVVDTIARRATSTDPEKRFRSARDMAEALGVSLADTEAPRPVVSDWLQRLEVPREGNSEYHQLLPGESPERVTAPRKRGPSDSARGHRLLVAAWVFLAVALLIAALSYWQRSSL